MEAIFVQKMCKTLLTTKMAAPESSSGKFRKVQESSGHNDERVAGNVF